jgi:predicted ATPase
MLEAMDEPARPFGPTLRLLRERGRDYEVDELVGQIERGARLVTLTGPGGVGKTQLALEIARRLRTHFGAVALALLASVHDPADVLAAIADSIGVRDAVGRPLIDALRNYLHSRSLLLVVDNCEHLLAAGPDLADLLDAAPGLVVLATSRGPLRIRGEHVQPLKPLTEDAAAELFAERTTQAGAPDDLDPSVVRTICRRLDRLPLAIELAAARTRVLPAALLAEQLDRTEARLDLPGPRDLPDRQRTLRVTIAWSYQLLSPDEQALLRAVAVFAGGWTLDAAAVVVGLDPAETLELHAGLIDASLIYRTGLAGKARFDLLETCARSRSPKPTRLARPTATGPDTAATSKPSSSRPVPNRRDRTRHSGSPGCPRNGTTCGWPYAGYSTTARSTASPGSASWGSSRSCSGTQRNTPAGRPKP